MKLFIKFFQTFKGRQIKIDPSVPGTYLLTMSFEKAFALLRGICKTQKLVFIGKGTTIRASNLFLAMKGVEISRFCQIDCLGHRGIKIGKGSKIGSHSILKVSGTLSDIGEAIEIGDNVGIGDFAHIGGASSVKIGNDTITGAFLSIHPENHNFADSSQLIRLQGVSRVGVSIGQNCWVGAKVTFLDGSKIGNGCVVAAGAVVTKAFPDRVLIGGIPARIIKRLDLGPQ